MIFIFCLPFSYPVAASRPVAGMRGGYAWRVRVKGLAGGVEKPCPKAWKKEKIGGGGAEEACCGSGSAATI